MNPTSSPVPTPVPDEFVLLQLTMIERSARQCREALCVAKELTAQAAKPQIELPSPMVAGRINGQLPPLQPSRQQQITQQAQHFAAQANIEIQNVIGHATKLMTALQGGTEGTGDGTTPL